MDCFPKYLTKLREIDILAETAQKALDTREENDRIQANATTRSALILLCGYLEGYIRALLTEITEKINDADPPIEILTPHLIYSSVEKFLPNINKGSNISKFIAVIRNEDSISLDPKILAKTGGNPTVDTIEKMFERFGIEAVIDKISIRDYGIASTFITESLITDSISRKIKAAITPHTISNLAAEDALVEIISTFNQTHNPKIKRRPVGYVGVIEDLLSKRNRIAHGESDEEVTPTDLRTAKNNVEKLIGSLNTIVDEQCKLLTPLASSGSTQPHI